jgi:hypothetical protein
MRTPQPRERLNVYVYTPGFTIIGLRHATCVHVQSENCFSRAMCMRIADAGKRRRKKGIEIESLDLDFAGPISIDSASLTKRSIIHRYAKKVLLVCKLLVTFSGALYVHRLELVKAKTLTRLQMPPRINWFFAAICWRLRLQAIVVSYFINRNQLLGRDKNNSLFCRRMLLQPTPVK